jgi:outer membrane protein assembly factor BamB
MPEEITLTQAGEVGQQSSKDVSRPPRLWPPCAFVLVFWALFFVVGALEKPYFVGFLYSMAAPALLVLLFFGWWWTRRRIPFLERLYCFCVVVGLIAVAPFCDRSILFGLPTTGLPLVLTTWTLWMLVVRKTGLTWNRTGLLAVAALTWASFTLIRIDGIDADLRADTRWRWEPSAEDLFLAEKAHRATATDALLSSSAASLEATPGDWTEFRGPQRDGVISGIKIATDWSTTPPKLAWRQRVGPAWSSVIVVGDRLFTQEQRGNQETVVCYEAAGGKEIWVQGDSCRFWEGVSGAGPRATPTFAMGRIYTMGGTGLVNCRDARTGRLEWFHDLVAEEGGKAPLWGYSGSPLVTDGLVIVYAGGPGGKLLAYRAESGDQAWSAPSSTESYSSPQVVTIGGKKQCLMLGDGGLTSHDLSTGAMLWTQGPPVPGAPRVVQPHLVGQTQLVATLGAMGVSLIDVAQESAGWKVDPVWATTQIKPEFPDFVVHEGHLYGFDGSVFCCVDLATGKRSWKEGRYGRGQVMLLAEQSLLLVLSETGEALLLAANPERHQELGRFRALEGKTWNHPVIAHGRLYVRNAEEMACYELRSP